MSTLASPYIPCSVPPDGTLESQLQYDADLLRVLRALELPLNDEQRRALRTNINAFAEPAKQQEWPREHDRHG